MRIGQINQGRPQPYDRNPVNRATNAFITAAPHGLTQRWIYTCPSLKKAFINNAFVAMMRRTVAAPASIITVEFDITFLDATGLVLVHLRSEDNTLSKQDRFGLGTVAPMVAGESASSFTADASTGGTVEYQTGAWIQEFDV